MKFVWRRILSGMLAAGIMATTTQAIAAPTGLLAHVLASHHAGKIIRTFPGPAGLTGVVMDYNGSKAIAYLTPDGKYLISGLVADLETGDNLTSKYGAEYIGKVDVIKGQPAFHIALQCASLSGITVGNPKAKNYLIAVFNPSTKLGYKIMGGMMGEAGNMQRQKTFNVAALKLVPVGPLAPAVLSAANPGRQVRLLHVLNHKPIGAVTSLGARFTQRNNTILSHIHVKLPFMVVYFPQAGTEAVLPLHSLMGLATAVNTAEVLGKGVQIPMDAGAH